MLRCIIFTILFVPSIIYAQYSLKGSVIKEDGTPLRSIAVQIKKHAFALENRYTDSTGTFIFLIPEAGSYELKLQSVLYGDTVIAIIITPGNKNVLLDPIQLQPIHKTLKAVTITARREILEFKDDHIVFIPSADPSIGSRPVSEVLNYIPGLLIDAKNSITAKGQENVQLLVNGRIIRMPAGDYLAQLNADEVEKIEVYDNAARFAYIKAPIVMNVVLKSRQQKKLWNAAINTNTLPKVNPSVNASFSLGKHRLYSRLSHDLSNFRSGGYQIRLKDSFHFKQVFENRTRHQMSTARFGWDYLADSATTLSIEGNYSRHTDRLDAEIEVASVNMHFRNQLISEPVEKEINGFITYRRKDKQEGYKMIELGIALFSLQNQRNLPGLSIIEERNMNNRAIGFKAEWLKNIQKFKLLNGAFGQFTIIKDLIDTVSLAHESVSNFDQKAITSFHEVSWQQKKWTATIGANIDFIELNLKKMVNAVFKYRQIFFNPSFRFNYIKGRSRVMFSYHRKYIMPSTHMMFGQYSQYEYGRITPGNYYLKPATQELVKLSFTTNNKVTMLLELYYDHNRNPVMMVNKITGMLITYQPENLKSRSSFGAVFSFNHTPLPLYSFTLNIDGRHSTYKLKEEVFVFNPVTWFGSATLINRIRISEKLQLSLNTSLHNWQTTFYRKMRYSLITVIQGSYKLNTRMNISLSINDPFNQSRADYTGMIAPGYFESGFTRNQMRNVFISIRYQLMNNTDKKSSTIKSFLSE